MTSVPISILVIDDNKLSVELLVTRLKAMGHDVTLAGDGQAGLDEIIEKQPNVAFLDLQMAGMNGMDVLEELQKREVDTTVVVITAYGSIERAVQAMRIGAYDFLTKPLRMEDVERTLRHAVERHALRAENASLTEDLSRQYGEIVSEDKKFRVLIEEARQAARANSTVLLLGESGTGKELFARWIHHWSPRRGRPFVAVNSAAIPETLFESEIFGHERGAFTDARQRRKGKLEQSQGGTLFLDEIGDLSQTAQAKLLRVLQDREFQRLGGEETISVDVRIIAASNRDLKKAVESGEFREDLFHRLNVLPFCLPPLRDRPDDLQPLVEHLVRKFCREVKRQALDLSEATMRCLAAYSWPGNIRELANTIERMAVLAPEGEVGPEYLPEEILFSPGAEAISGDANGGAVSKDHNFHRGVLEAKRLIIEEALAKCGGVQVDAAELLGLNPTHLSRLMKQLGLR